MNYMLCRHRVEDFDRWLRIFNSDLEGQQKAGLHLLYLLHDPTDRNHIVYLFRVDDVEKARAFTETPEAEQAANDSGVVGPFQLLWLTDLK